MGNNRNISRFETDCVLHLARWGGGGDNSSKGEREGLQ